MSLKYILAVIVFVGTVFLAGANVLYAATISFSPATKTVSTGDSFVMSVVVDGEGESINAADATMSFDIEKLSVLNISKDNSAFNLWTSDPTFSNTQGTIEFSGGGTSSFSGSKQILSISFKALAEGSANISVSSGKVLAADGYGTDVLSGTSGASITIGEKKATPPPVNIPTPSVPQHVVSQGVRPSAPVVSSITHPEEDLWYNAEEAVFSWILPKTVTSLRILFDTIPDSTPEEEYDPPIEEKTFSELEEGEWYLHIMFKNVNGWGEITHRKVFIDKTPPIAFPLSFTQEAGANQYIDLAFGTTDALSGIDRYTVAVGKTSPLTVQPEELATGTYRVTARTNGTHTIKVTAFDKAGNTTSTDVDVSVSDIVEAVAETTSNGTSANFAYWVSLFFAMVASFMGAVVMYEHKKIKQEREAIRKEANDAREKMERIFSVLHSEVEEQVTVLARKPNMSDVDREVLTNLQEALEISQELLDKEMDDIRKLV